MSRIGRQPIPVPAGVSIAIDPGRVMVNGPLGELTQQVPVRIKLELQGVGYRAALRGTSLELNVGYSHPVVIDAPDGVTFEVPAPTQIVVKGVDKQQVGEIAAEIRKVR